MRSTQRSAASLPQTGCDSRHPLRNSRGGAQGTCAHRRSRVAIPRRFYPSWAILLNRSRNLCGAGRRRPPHKQRRIWPDVGGMVGPRGPAIPALEGIMAKRFRTLAAGGLMIGLLAAAPIALAAEEGTTSGPAVGNTVQPGAAMHKG